MRYGWFKRARQMLVMLRQDRCLLGFVTMVTAQVPQDGVGLEQDQISVLELRHLAEHLRQRQGGDTRFKTPGKKKLPHKIYRSDDHWRL